MMHADESPSDPNLLNDVDRISTLQNEITSKLGSSLEKSIEHRKKLEGILNVDSEEPLKLSSIKRDIIKLSRKLEVDKQKLENSFQKQNKQIKELKDKLVAMHEVMSEKIEATQKLLADPEKFIKTKPPKFLPDQEKLYWESLQKQFRKLGEDVGTKNIQESFNPAERGKLRKYLNEQAEFYKLSNQDIESYIKSAKNIIKTEQSNTLKPFTELKRQIDANATGMQHLEDMERKKLRDQLKDMINNLETFQENILDSAETYSNANYVKIPSNLTGKIVHYFNSLRRLANVEIKKMKIRKNLRKGKTKDISWLRKKAEKAKENTGEHIKGTNISRYSKM